MCSVQCIQIKSDEKFSNTLDSYKLRGPKEGLNAYVVSEGNRQQFKFPW